MNKDLAIIFGIGAFLIALLFWAVFTSYQKQAEAYNARGIEVTASELFWGVEVRLVEDASDGQ